MVCGLYFPERFQISPGQVLVYGAAVPDLFQLFRTDLLDDFGGRAHNKTVRWNFFLEGNKTPGTNQTVGVDLDTIGKVPCPMCESG